MPYKKHKIKSAHELEPNEIGLRTLERENLQLKRYIKELEQQINSGTLKRIEKTKI